MTQDVIQVVISSFQVLWAGSLMVLGKIVLALIVLIIGLIVASGISAIVERLIKIIKLDDFLKKLGIEEHFGRAGLKINSARFFGKLVYWFFVVAVLVAITEVLDFQTISSFLYQVLLYIPNVVIAVIILLAAIVVAHFLRGVVTASVKSAKLHSPALLGSITWWAVVIFGFLAALSQIGVAVSIINALVTGFVAMLAIAGGIAFGLGGKDAAAGVIEQLGKRVREK